MERMPFWLTSKMFLREIIKMLEQHTSLRLMGRGHTGNHGNAAAKPWSFRTESQQSSRGLSAHGVGGSRLSAKGFSQMNPVADNATEDGRNEKSALRVSEVMRQLTAT